jgi:hypothetical protein
MNGINSNQMTLQNKANGTYGFGSRQQLNSQRLGIIPEHQPFNKSLAKIGDKPKLKQKSLEAEDALIKSKNLEQPWTIREGQEWKTKVFGRGQKTQTEGHAFRSYREAIDAAKREDVEAVFLNRGIRKVTNHPIEKPNTRPDVTIRRTDGRVDQIEVPSKTDKDYLLMERMETTNNRLPEGMRGEFDLKKITKDLTK